MKRAVLHEPAYVLHRYDFSESSLIVECFTRRHGRIAVVAKGAKRPSSNFRPILLPLQPLMIGFGGEAEIRTLKAAEWAGGQVMPTGEALLSGYYMNELLMRLLARDDPHPGLYDAYGAAVRVLAGLGATQAPPQAEEPSRGPGPALHSAALRAFELVLLREIGLLPTLDAETPTLASLQPEARYTLHAEGGLVRARADDSALSGLHWQMLQAALDDEAPFTATLHAAGAAGAPLRHQLRALLHYHCGIGMLRTRQLMLDIQSL